jgi:hypothetical protein
MINLPLDYFPPKLSRQREESFSTQTPWSYSQFIFSANSVKKGTKIETLQRFNRCQMLKICLYWRHCSRNYFFRDVYATIFSTCLWSVYTLGPGVMKLFTAVLNSVTKKADVFVKAPKKWMTIKKTLACCTAEFIKDVKSLMMEGPLEWSAQHRDMMKTLWECATW